MYAIFEIKQEKIRLFPDVTKIVFASDASGNIKARLKVGVAAKDVRRGKAKKISDNLIQYKCFWNKKKPIELKDDEIVLLKTISRNTNKYGWLKAADDQIVKELFLHNECVIRLEMSGLESIKLGCVNPVADIREIYKKGNANKKYKEQR